MHSLEKLIMPPRRDWNALGPPVPAWFRVRLKRIDPRLTIQFIPSNRKVRNGVDSMQYPHGLWVICRRMRGTGWLFKRWIWRLCDQHGRYAPPGYDTAAIIRKADRMWRRGKHDVLERMFEDTINKMRYEKEEASKKKLRNHISALCRAHDIRVGSHVFMPTSRVA